MKDKEFGYAMKALRMVIRREWHRMTSRRLYLGVCVVLPLLCLFFMATIFGNGQMENIPVGIVDLDNTATSRNISRRISAAPTFRVTEHFTDEADARRALQQKDIYGYLVIPPRFEQKAVTGTGATLTYYYHYALLSVGSELMAAFENTLAPVALSPIVMQAEALGVSGEQIQTFLLPVEASTHPLYNPDMDYSIYLSQPFFFVLFQILILLTTVYSIGGELKFGSAGEWLKTARGNILTAVAGKLLPYTLIFSSIGILANYVLFGPLHIPFAGSLWLMNAVTVLFIIATQALAVFIYSVFPKIAYIISVVSMVGSLGATLSGVTFPVTAMYAPVHAASYLFPVRHFTEAAQAMIYFDAGFAYFWQSVATLFIFLLAALLILPLLKWWIKKEIREEAISASPSPCPPTALSTASVIRHEWHAIATNPAILLVLAGGIFLYGLLYNYMYAPNLVRKAPVAVVDLSHSALSREYIRLLDATPQTAVYGQTPNILEARQWMKQGDVAGILYLPADFEARVARGETSVFVLYAATDAFLNFKGLQESSARVMLAVNDAHRMEGTVFLPPQGLLAVASSAPVSVSGTALYNYTEGYGSYLIPAVLIVIIFQTMLMVIAMLTGEEAEAPADACRLIEGYITDCRRQDLRILHALRGVFPIPAGTVAAPVQHPTHRQRRRHRHNDDTLPAGHEFPCPGRLPLVYRLRSAVADDSLLLCGLYLPFGRVLSAGADAVVLADSPLSVSGRSCRTCFCKTEFNGWNAGRRMAADADDVDTSIGLWNFGALHYTPPLRKRKSEGIKKGYLSQTANLLLTLNLIL